MTLGFVDMTGQMNEFMDQVQALGAKGKLGATPSKNLTVGLRACTSVNCCLMRVSWCSNQPALLATALVRPSADQPSARIPPASLRHAVGRLAFGMLSAG